MPGKKRPYVFADNKISKSFVKSELKQVISRKCKIVVTPLEHSPLRTIYFSLLHARKKSAPNVYNLNHMKKPMNSLMDTITIVDIDEIKNRTLEHIPSTRIVKIKPIPQKHLSRKVSAKPEINKFDRRFFSSFVNLENINYEQYKKIAPMTYNVNPDAISLLRTQNGVSTQNHNKSEPILNSPEQLNCTKFKALPHEEVYTTPVLNYFVTQSTPSTDIKFTSRIYSLQLKDCVETDFVDPYESLPETPFQFENIAYNISNTKKYLRFPSHQWCTSLRQDIVDVKESDKPVKLKFGELSHKFYENKTVTTKITSSAQIRKMKCFHFWRYQLAFQQGQITTVTDRSVAIHRNGEYHIKMQGTSVKLCAAPPKVKNIRDIEILLNIIDKVKLKHELVIVN